MKLIIKKETSEGTVLDSINEFEKAKLFLLKYKIDIAQIELCENGEFKEPYENFVENFKKKEEYISSDIVTLTKETPQEILDPFKKIHHHTDDEVRFTIEGEGVFGIVPDSKTEIEIFCAKGDLINCVRIFKENPKWEAIYDADVLVAKN